MPIRGKLGPLTALYSLKLFWPVSQSAQAPVYDTIAEDSGVPICGDMTDAVCEGNVSSRRINSHY